MLSHTHIHTCIHVHRHTQTDITSVVKCFPKTSYCTCIQTSHDNKAMYLQLCTTIDHKMHMYVLVHMCVCMYMYMYKSTAHVLGVQACNDNITLLSLVKLLFHSQERLKEESTTWPGHHTLYIHVYYIAHILP